MTGKRTDTMSQTDSGKGFPGLTRVRQAALFGTGTLRYQLPGESCPDCDGKEWELGDDWCFNEQHPTYIHEGMSSEHHRIHHLNRPATQPNRK